MEDQQVSGSAAAVASAPGGCSTCGGGGAAPSSAQGQITLIGQVSAAFPSVYVEKEFAHLLGQKDFKGFTDGQTMHAVLSQRQNRYLARKLCFLHTPYGSGTAPAYVLVPEAPEDLDLLIDTLKRSPSASEFDVVKGQVVGIAPPAMCNTMQLPLVAFSQLYSFGVGDFVKSIPRPAETPAADFEAACDEVFHRALRIASNASGPMLALSYALLSYAGLYNLVAQKYSENSSLANVSVQQSPANPDLAEVRLKFVKRDNGYSESYCFGVNYAGPFQHLEEPLHPCFELS
jgi:hypothetical protein